MIQRPPRSTRTATLFSLPVALPIYFLGQHLPSLSIGRRRGIEFDTDGPCGLVVSCGRFGRFGHVSKIIRTHRQRSTGCSPATTAPADPATEIGRAHG